MVVNKASQEHLRKVIDSGVEKMYSLSTETMLVNVDQLRTTTLSSTIGSTMVVSILSLFSGCNCYRHLGCNPRNFHRDHYQSENHQKRQVRTVDSYKY